MFAEANICRPDVKAAIMPVAHDLNHLGSRGIPLAWLASYLTDRQQYLMINDQISPNTKVVCGVPQGSVLSPLLFLIHILPLPLSSLLQFNCNYHDYETRSRFHLNKSFLRHQFAIGYQAPNIWNDIPINVRSSLTTNNFKKSLKSYYLTL